MKLYVGNLSYGLTEEALKETFEKFGTVTSALIIKDKFSGRSKGFGFVEFEDDAAGTKAVEELNQTEIDGRKVIVSEARPQEDRPRRPSFGGSRGGFNGGSRDGGFRRE